MNIRTAVVTCASVLLAALGSFALVKYDQIPAATTAVIVLGFPGFAFAMMVYPGVHADKSSIAVSMLVVNALFCIGAIRLWTKIFKRRKTAEPTAGRPESHP